MTYYKNIGILGKARSGKDSVARRLVTRWGFRRVAFADPLKAVALKVDPWVSGVRLSQLVNDIGWESAKDQYPEVRRILQQLGQSVRELDEQVWIRAALNAIDVNEAASLPTVVTDVRYMNEARALLDHGFMLVRVWRPSAVDSTPGAAARHPSETELDNWATPVTVVNYSTLDALYAQVDALPEPR